MKLIIGLGNPGTQYQFTRHNFGFRVVDALREELHLPEWKNDKHMSALVTRGIVESTTIIIAKPTTFMNKSGIAANALVSQFEPDPNEIVIVHDDADLPFGSVKLEKKESAGGHHGIESIITNLGTNEFWRLRLGIRTTERDASDLTDYALNPFRPEEQETVNGMVATALERITETIGE